MYHIVVIKLHISQNKYNIYSYCLINVIGINYLNVALTQHTLIGKITYLNQHDFFPNHKT